MRTSKTFLVGSCLATLVGLAACGEGGSSKAPGSAEAATTGAPAASGTATATGNADALKVGDEAPDVTFTLHDGKTVKLADLKGKQVLVYFYPKDDTPGCTTEAKGIKESWEKFQTAGIEVYGVSTQDEASHKAFIDKYGLPFPLVVDTDASVAKAFKVPLKGSHAARQSFLIGADGTIKEVWLSVDPSEHADAVLSAAKS